MTARHWPRGIRLRLPVNLSVRTFFLVFFGIGFANAADRVYDAADLVRAARMIEGIIPADPDFADLDGDGQVTANDLALMLRRVHGQELPVRLEQKTIGPSGGTLGHAETFLLTVPEGALVTATATPVDGAQPSGFGGTSEFSAAVTILDRIFDDRFQSEVN